MAPCSLCNDLKKRDDDDPRLACDISPGDLLKAGLEIQSRCASCSFIVEGILKFEDATWTLAKDVSRVYLYALSDRFESLTLELYFYKERPKLVLEFYHTEGT
jgi:hypothetical protein